LQSGFSGREDDPNERIGNGSFFISLTPVLMGDPNERIGNGSFFISLTPVLMGDPYIPHYIPISPIKP
jgi:hypothetical protein